MYLRVYGVGIYHLSRKLIGVFVGVSSTNEQILFAVGLIILGS